MAVASTFPGCASGQSICSKPVTALTHRSLSLATTFHERKALKTSQQQQHACMRKRAVNKSYRNLRLPLVMSSMSNPNISLNPLSSSDTIKQFYTYINERNLKQLSKFISNDCIFDDFSFPQPFQGKKEVMQFLEQLITCMGQNVEFNIGRVWEGDDLTAGVTWHLEWRKKQLPFTRGSSFYECTKEGARLVIKKAHSVTESPIKPGVLVLTLLKTMTSLFDAFPHAAEWFLKNPYFILQPFLKIYKIVWEPSIVALLECYIKIWNFVAPLLIYTFKILIYISNIFSNKRTST